MRAPDTVDGMEHISSRPMKTGGKLKNLGTSPVEMAEVGPKRGVHTETRGGEARKGGFKAFVERSISRKFSLQGMQTHSKSRTGDQSSLVSRPKMSLPFVCSTLEGKWRRFESTRSWLSNDENSGGGSLNFRGRKKSAKESAVKGGYLCARGQLRLKTVSLRSVKAGSGGK